MRDVQTKFLKSLYTAPSPISGTGLFTSEKIRIGEPILCYGGSFVDKSRRYSGEVIRSTSIYVTENVILCELIDSTKDYSDYINHSCDPNIGMLDSLTVVAIKDVPNGSELLIDYAFYEGNEDYFMKQPCNCQSKNCRKHINGQYWKTIDSSDRYFNYFSPFIKRRILTNGKEI
jgi:SET domain-containing protein